MSLEETLEQLEALGDEKRRPHSARIGAGDSLLGAKLGDIRKLAKQIKTHHELALALRETGNFARGARPDRADQPATKSDAPRSAPSKAEQDPTVRAGEVDPRIWILSRG